MITYRDRTYCTRTDCSHMSTCPRILEPGTDTLGLPVAYSEFTDCYEPEKLLEKIMEKSS
jgi:hypothetical protein